MPIVNDFEPTVTKNTSSVEEETIADATSAPEEVTQTDETAEPLNTEENASETEEGDNVEVSEDNVGEAEASEEGQPEESEETEDEMDEVIREFEEATLTDDEIFSKLRALPYLDLYAEEKALARQANDLFGIKMQMDSIKNMSVDVTTAMVNMMDTLTQQSSVTEEMAGIMTSVDKFYKGYESMMNYLLNSRHIAKRMLNAFDKDMVMSSAFISKSAIECADIRRSNVWRDQYDKDGNVIPVPNRALMLKRIENSIACYEDRTDTSILFSKMRNPNKTLETFKQFRKIGPEEAMNEINKVFMPVFNDMYMAKFRKRFVDLLLMVENEDLDENHKVKEYSQVVDVNVFFLTYWLAYVYNRELASGKCGQVRSLVMNVYDSDPSSDIYDLPGGIPYLARICYVIYVIITNSISEEYTSKQLNKAINAMIDTMLPLISAEHNAKLFEEYPGKVIEHGTSLNAILDPETKLEDLDDVDWDPSPQEVWDKKHKKPEQQTTPVANEDITTEKDEEEIDLPPAKPDFVMDTDDDGCIEVDDESVPEANEDAKYELPMDDATAAREEFYEDTGKDDITSSNYEVDTTAVPTEQSTAEDSTTSSETVIVASEIETPTEEAPQASATPTRPRIVN